MTGLKNSRLFLCAGMIVHVFTAANSHACCRFLDSGGVYKLAFGPKAFIVVSDPVVVRHLLKVKRFHCALHPLSSSMHLVCTVDLCSKATDSAAGRGLQHERCLPSLRCH